MSDTDNQICMDVKRYGEVMVYGKSQNLANIASALSKFLGEVSDVSKDKQGYGYKFADLSSVLDISRPLLAKHKLAIMQSPVNVSNKAGIITLLLHESGEWIESGFFVEVEKMTIISSQGKVKTNYVQTCGIIFTYIRRYALAAALGISQVDSDGVDTDDDSGELLGELIGLFNSLDPKERTALMDKLKIKTLQELSPVRMKGAIEWLKNRK